MATIEEWVQGARAAVPPEVIDVELEGDLPGWPQDKSIAGSTGNLGLSQMLYNQVGLYTVIT